MMYEKNMETAAFENGELDESSLEGVSGGLVGTALVGYLIACAGVGAGAAWINFWGKKLWK